MKFNLKLLTAISISTLCAGSFNLAYAENSLTIYGFLDGGYGYQNYKYKNNDVKIKSHSSGLRDRLATPNRWGVRGSEDLGNGLRAVFQLEAGAPLATPMEQPAGFARLAFVGLADDKWGTLTMGRQYSAGQSANTNLTINGMGLGNMNRVFGPVGVAREIGVNNAFKYTSPSFGGLSLIALYGADSTEIERVNGESTSERGSRVSLGFKYNNKDFAMAGSYDRHTDKNTKDKPIVNWQINGSYDFGLAQLGLAYGQDKEGKLGWVGHAQAFLPEVGSPAIQGPSLPEGFRANNYHVGLNVPISQGRLYLGWLRSDSNLDDSNKWGGNAGNINTYHANYKYFLSKRTTVYAYGSYGKNLGYLEGLEGTEFGLGVMHTF